MSVEFTLKGVECSLERAEELLRDWERQQPLGLYELPELTGDDSSGYYAHLWGPGSIRGVLMSFQPRGKLLTVRFNAFSSRQDWRNGFSLLRRALDLGGGTLSSCGGSQYQAVELTDRRAEQEAVDDFVRSSQVLIERKRREFQIPLGSFSLKLRTHDLPPCSPAQVPEVESLMSARVERYATAHQAGSWKDKSGASCGRWNLGPCLVPTVDVVHIDGESSLKLPFRRLKALLGERAEDCGELTYLPALTRSKDPLWRKLLSESASQ